MTIQKEWTLLIYANGNNELAPEFYKLFQQALHFSDTSFINIVFQISLSDEALVKTLRPFEKEIDLTMPWVGTRRYLIAHHRAILLEELTLLNMAHPCTLTDFIVWGATHYPASHYILLLGGHCYQFVGCMTDYSGSLPYMMGMPELCKSLQTSCTFLNITLDFLIMDTCYFNFVENLYELGHSLKPSVHYLFTPIINAPLAGFPLFKFLECLVASPFATVPHVLSTFLPLCTFDCVVFKINHSILKQLKVLFHLVATHAYEITPDLPSDLTLLLKSPYLASYIQEITRLTGLLIINLHYATQKPFPLLNIASIPPKDKTQLEAYQKLAFAKDNDWFTLLKRHTTAPSSSQPVLTPTLFPEPLLLPPKVILSYIRIMNPGLGEAIHLTIFYKFLHYTHWQIKK